MDGVSRVLIALEFQHDGLKVFPVSRMGFSSSSILRQFGIPAALTWTTLLNCSEISEYAF